MPSDRRVENLLSEMLEMNRTLNDSLERLGDKIDSISGGQGYSMAQQPISLSSPSASSIKSSKAKGGGTGAINRGTDALKGNMFVDFAEAVLNFRAVIDKLENTLGSQLITEGYNKKGKYNVYENAQQQTTQYAQSLAAQGYNMQGKEVADVFSQFYQIEERKYNAERKVKRLTTRGTRDGWATGQWMFAQNAVDVETGRQEIWDNTNYIPMAWLFERMANETGSSAAKTQAQSKMQLRIWQNNATHDSGGY